MGSLDNWCSPPEVTEPLEQFFEGPVDFDPCSNDRSIVKARLYNDQPIGCAIPWFGRHHGIRVRTAYENPPYSGLLPFTVKGLVELIMSTDDDNELVRLVTVSPSTQWWRYAVGHDEPPVVNPNRRPRKRRWPKPSIICTERLFFIGEDGRVDKAHRKRQSARFDSALLYYGWREPEFFREFKSITSWSLSRRSV